mmetsp:Transcript_29566/g.73239  ORF Transcript_29566/g.73239 Transcript_29566/m.73239 type:complete len:320 (+) Transcript_29566:676-1635(+)
MTHSPRCSYDKRAVRRHPVVDGWEDPSGEVEIRQAPLEVKLLYLLHPHRVIPHEIAYIADFVRAPPKSQAVRRPRQALLGGFLSGGARVPLRDRQVTEPTPEPTQSRIQHSVPRVVELRIPGKSQLRERGEPLRMPVHVVVLVGVFDAAHLEAELIPPVVLVQLRLVPRRGVVPRHVQVPVLGLEVAQARQYLVLEHVVPQAPHELELLPVAAQRAQQRQVPRVLAHKVAAHANVFHALPQREPPQRLRHLGVVRHDVRLRHVEDLVLLVEVLQSWNDLRQEYLLATCSSLLPLFFQLRLRGHIRHERPHLELLRRRFC